MNIVETRDKVFPILGEASSPSNNNICVTTQYRQQFSNQLAIITLRGDTEAIRFDGRPVTQWSRAWNYAYAAFPVSHGAHYITVTRGSDARFTAYAYGHSIVGTSSGAYGFTVSYTGRRMRVLTCFLLLSRRRNLTLCVKKSSITERGFITAFQMFTDT